MIENVSLEIMDFGVGAINAVGGDLKSGMQQHVWNMRNLTSCECPRSLPASPLPGGAVNHAR
jgi:hypothetical protein